MQLMDGKKAAQQVRDEVRLAARNAVLKYGEPVVLAVVLVGDNPASKVYVANKEKACADVGFVSRVVRLPASSTQDEVQAAIERLNKDASVHGILLQLPLPDGLDSAPLLACIDPQKDVDGLHVLQRGRLFAGQPCLAPCTPQGVMRLLSDYRVPLDGANAVVIGRSELVGKPLAMMLLAANATVTICHSHTRNLADICRTADVLVSAVGKPRFVTADMVKEGAVVVDVGINRTVERLVGDVDFDAVAPRCRLITPVPGGVGPMTVAMLLCNTLQAYCAAHARDNA